MILEELGDPVQIKTKITIQNGSVFNRLLNCEAFSSSSSTGYTPGSSNSTSSFMQAGPDKRKQPSAHRQLRSPASFSMILYVPGKVFDLLLVRIHRVHIPLWLSNHRCNCRAVPVYYVGDEIHPDVA
jgi:hypothetical protein